MVLGTVSVLSYRQGFRLQLVAILEAEVMFGWIAKCIRRRHFDSMNAFAPLQLVLSS
jgi:hypothetical protein